MPVYFDIVRHGQKPKREHFLILFSSYLLLK